MLGRLRITVAECIGRTKRSPKRSFTLKRTTLLPSMPAGAFSAKALESVVTASN